jgi:hypothetical protein
LVGEIVMLKLVELVIAVLAAGCATMQVPPSQARPVPADRVLASGSDGDAEIVVVRDSGFMGAGCFHGLEVNRRLVARMDAGEILRIRVPAGDLLLTVRSDPQGKALCGAFPGVRVQREFAIKAGEVKHFRLVVGSGGLDVMRSDF